MQDLNVFPAVGGKKSTQERETELCPLTSRSSQWTFNKIHNGWMFRNLKKKDGGGGKEKNERAKRKDDRCGMKERW